LTDDLGPLRTYAGYMEDLRARTALVLSLASGQHPLPREEFRTELACLQLRKSLELLAFASLTAHRDAYAAVYSDFSKHWRAKTLLDKLEKLHPEFYPKPLSRATTTPDGIKHFDEIRDGFLTKEDFVFLYGKTSEVIHTRNPFTTAPPVVDFERGLDEWVHRIQVLLSTHYIRLLGVPDLWLVVMKSEEDERVHVYRSSPHVPSDGTSGAT
jgi:hypothetical protein